MADSKPFDPMAQFAEMQAMWANWMNPFRPFGMTMPGMPRYEGIDPTVQEIAVLAAMHNMATTLSNPTAIKNAISAEISERAKRLG